MKALISLLIYFFTHILLYPYTSLPLYFFTHITPYTRLLSFAPYAPLLKVKVMLKVKVILKVKLLSMLNVLTPLSVSSRASRLMRLVSCVQPCASNLVRLSRASVCVCLCLVCAVVCCSYNPQHSFTFY